MGAGNVLGAFWEDDTKLDVCVFNALGLFRALQEWDLENMTVAGGELPEEVLDIRVPSHAERVVPPSEHREARLDLETGLSLIAPESRCRDIPDDVREVRVQASYPEGELQLLKGGGSGAVVLLLGPFNS